MIQNISSDPDAIIGHWCSVIKNGITIHLIDFFAKKIYFLMGKYEPYASKALPANGIFDIIPKS